MQNFFLAMTDLLEEERHCCGAVVEVKLIEEDHKSKYLNRGTGRTEEQVLNEFAEALTKDDSSFACSIRELRFDFGYRKATPIVSFESLKHFANLEKLTFYRYQGRITNDELNALVRSLPSMSSLETLRLDGTSVRGIAPFVGNGIAALAKCLPQTSIKNLQFVDHLIGEDGTTALASLLPKTHLQELSLRGNSVGVNGVFLLAEYLPLTTRIKTLDLSDNAIGHDGTAALATCLPYTNVEELVLSDNSLRDKDVAVLASALPQTSVKKLVLQTNSIGAEGAAALAKILPQTKIETLDLYLNSIHEEGALSLAKFLPETRIKELDLDYNGIGNEGAAAVARYLIKTNMESLSLNGNQINLYKRLLNGAKNCTSLQKFSLYDNYGQEGLEWQIDRYTYLNQDIAKMIKENRPVTNPFWLRVIEESLRRKIAVDVLYHALCHQPEVIMKTTGLTHHHGERAAKKQRVIPCSSIFWY